MKKARQEIFDDQNLSVLAKASLKLSNSIVVKNLKSGSWLDLLSGYGARLQRSQVNNSRVIKFVSLDRKLNKNLNVFGIYRKELQLNKKLPIMDRSFDNITIINGLEHLWHEGEILAECYRVLKIGGCLQIVVPTWFGKPILEFFAFRLGWRQEKIEMEDHKRYYDEKHLWPLLVKAGFSPSKTKMKRIKMLCSLYSLAMK